jgi:signal peptidase II
MLHMGSVTRIIIVGLTLFGCVGCDQASKSIARSYLVPGTSESLLHDVVRLQLVQNSGAFLSAGASLPGQTRFAVFILAVAGILLGIVFAALFAKRLSAARRVALALIAGGGASNLIDRLLDDGGVTDFLNLGIGPIRTGIFNVADMAILAGALLIMCGCGAVAVHRAIHGGD